MRPRHLLPWPLLCIPVGAHTAACIAWPHQPGTHRVADYYRDGEDNCQAFPPNMVAPAFLGLVPTRYGF